MNSFGSAVKLISGAILKPWKALSQLEFLVLVGVTGVGKSTTLEALQSTGLSFGLLPDRRLVTDVVMIQALAGQTVTDREQRFALTAQYRELHPGGMAHAIGGLCINLESLGQPLIFDGLRGLDEVSYAAMTYSSARFIILDAPDTVRVQRLLGRSDAFDQVSTDTSSMLRRGNEYNLLEQLEAIQGVHAVFSNQQLAQLAALHLSAVEIVAKTKIVVTERRNYDPVAARNFLKRMDAQRVLYVDTTASNPTEIARSILEWL